ncbi:larval cuticle protein A2B-like [Bicyclus anynana]|uniref:Larval cuticle protein A2B-like n=1 Tax=Bicyclus anynana TaxID=110368 RepID=A0A6J1NH70_BICAN|nr:larval cuticle protein A2B-like [Bicyclus anynana]
MSRAQRFTPNPFYKNNCDMLQAVLYACVLQAVAAIIVTDPPPTSTEYNYWYDIIDPSTGDAKSQREFRQGDIVKGSYSVVDPDGTKRTVEYTADAKHGFKAVVRNEPVMHNTINKRHYVAHYPSFVQSHVIPVPNFYPYPFPYSRRLEVPIFSKSKFVEREQTNYFTPGNVTSTKLTFNKGEFFIPNYMK